MISFVELYIVLCREVIRKMIYKIENLLHSGGVSHRYIGHTYFIRAVMLAVENPERLHHICKEIYEPIAEEYHTSSTAVERNIRTIRDVFVRNQGVEKLEQLGLDYIMNQCPYPGELIEIFAYYCSKF